MLKPAGPWTYQLCAVICSRSKVVPTSATPTQYHETSHRGLDSHHDAQYIWNRRELCLSFATSCQIVSLWPLIPSLSTSKSPALFADVLFLAVAWRTTDDKFDVVECQEAAQNPDPIPSPVAQNPVPIPSPVTTRLDFCHRHHHPFLKMYPELQTSNGETTLNAKLGLCLMLEQIWLYSPVPLRLSWRSCSQGSLCNRSPLIMPLIKTTRNDYTLLSTKVNGI